MINQSWLVILKFENACFYYQEPGFSDNETTSKEQEPYLNE
jgi:hypothetical protein